MVETIREVFQYLRQFTGKTFVIKVEYPVIQDTHFSVLMRDVAFLHEVGIRIILVPGAKERIDEILADYHVEGKTIRGIRVTSHEAMPFIKMAAFDVANRVMTSLSASSINAVIGNWVRARGIGVVEGTDYQSAGTVEKVFTDRLRRVLEDGFIPILPCIGWSSIGRPYNISSSELAVISAARIGAEKLFFLTDGTLFTAPEFAVPEGVPIAPGGRISNFSLPDLERFFQLNADKEEKMEILRMARKACESGVERVHILDGRTEGSLLSEIFSNLGSGTMVYAHQYAGIRPMRPDEIVDVLRLMKPFVEQGILIPRTEEILSETYQDYIVFEIDDAIHACAALHTYPDGIGEIAAVAVDEQYTHLGVGPKLIGYLLEKARNLGLKHVFVLTVATADWFLKLGFEEADLTVLPEKKRAVYDLKRRSRILVKELS
jgi:amino-acid N-acetyltransferase